jgi:hypothetical protein
MLSNSSPKKIKKKINRIWKALGVDDKTPFESFRIKIWGIKNSYRK